MSAKMITRAWKKCSEAKPQLSSSEKLMLVFLSDFSNNDGYCMDLSRENIAKDLRMTPRNARRILTSLEDKRLVTVLASYQPDGGNGPNSYELHI